MEPRAKEESAVVQKRWEKACDYCPVCNHLRVDPDSAASKIPLGKHDAENCPFCNAASGIYWEGKEKSLPEERALRIWKAL
jgi:uncharacterized protein with PIN domain